MTSTVACGRQGFINLGLDLLPEGLYPAALSIDAVCGMLEVTKGAFNNYFDNAADWYQDVCGQWARRRADERGRDARAVALTRDPAKRLRNLRALAVDAAVSDASMRAWAATARRRAGDPGRRGGPQGT